MQFDMFEEVLKHFPEAKVYQTDGLSDGYVDECIGFDDWFFIYQQSTGEFGVGSYFTYPDGVRFHSRTILARGYSGHGEGYCDNPAAEHVVGKGPIPRGRWLVGRGKDHRDLGRLAIPLTPWQGTDTHGRHGFYIHGDNKAGNYTGSRGCIILPFPVRAYIDSTTARSLFVIA